MKLTCLAVHMKERTLKGFGRRLADIRRSRAMTQAELGEAVGVSKRVIAYYEQADAQSRGALLIDLARALRVSTDQLLGLKAQKETPDPRAARLLKRLQRIEQLPSADIRVVLKMIDGLLDRHARANGRG
ncbi:MAG: helix-turn-helix transcriptional regulator [Acidobacteriota bacterium]